MPGTASSTPAVRTARSPPADSGHGAARTTASLPLPPPLPPPPPQPWGKSIVLRAAAARRGQLSVSHMLAC